LDFLGLLESGEPGYFISLETAFNWIGEPESFTKYCEDANFRKNFIKRNLRNEKISLIEAESEDDITKDFIMRQNSKKNKMEFPWFSIEGFKLLCMTVGEKSYLVRKYFIQIEADYYRVLRQDSEVTKQELQTLRIKLDSHTNGVLALQNKADRLELENANLAIVNEAYSDIKNLIKTGYSFAYEAGSDNIIYDFLKKKHMQALPVFVIDDRIVQDKYRKKVKNEDSADYPECLSYEVPFDTLYSHVNMGTDIQDTEFYFYLPTPSTKGYKKHGDPKFCHVGKVDIYSSDHFRKLKAKIEARPDALTPTKGIFRSSLAEIQDAAKSVLVELYESGVRDAIKCD
jgi:hypothetical protein